MICLITDWINTLIEICIDKKNRAQLSVNYTIKHDVYTVMIRTDND